jgi:hypothetical protein
MIRERAGVEQLARAAAAVGEDVVDVVAGDVDQVRQVGRGRVEVAAEHERRAGRPAPRGRGRRRDIGADLLGRMRRGVQVHDPAGAAERDTVRDAALGAPRQLERAVVRDRGAADEDRVAPAAVRGDQIGVARRDRAPQRQQLVAARQRRPGARPGGGRKRSRPPRRDLLEQGDVPVPGRERRGELRGQRAPGRRLRAAVEQVPGQDEDPAKLPDPDVDSGACRATS